MSTDAALAIIEPAAPTRKRGAQPGNLNALKHGLYARHILANADELEQATTPGLLDEIAMLRGVMARVLRISTEAEETDIVDQYHLLAAMGTAAIRVATLLRTQKLLGDSSATGSAVLAEALYSVMEELSLKP